MSSVVLRTVAGMKEETYAIQVVTESEEILMALGAVNERKVGAQRTPGKTWWCNNTRITILLDKLLAMGFQHSGMAANKFDQIHTLIRPEPSQAQPAASQPAQSAV